MGDECVWGEKVMQKPKVLLDSLRWRPQVAMEGPGEWTKAAHLFPEGGKKRELPV